MQPTSKYGNNLKAFLFEKQREKDAVPDQAGKPSAKPAFTMLQVKEWINQFALQMTFPWVLGLALGITVFAAVFVLLTQPKLDAVSDIRLFEHYADKPINNLETDKRFVYLATDGNGLQRYDKHTYLWKTYKEKNTEGKLPNYVDQVALDSSNKRLWLLSGDKNVITTPKQLKTKSIEKLLHTSTAWANLSEAEISCSDKLDLDLFFGSINNGAARYNLSKHAWTTFPEASTRVSQIGFNDNRFFIAGNRGVHIYNPALDYAPDTLPALEGTSIRQLNFGSSMHLGLSQDSSLYTFTDQKWSPPFGGGTGLIGVTTADVSIAESRNNKLFVAADGEGLAIYDQLNHRWSALANGYDFRQMTSTDSFTYTTHEKGLRVYVQKDSLREIPGSYVHQLNEVFIHHNSGKSVFYSTDDQALWRIRNHKPEVLLPIPDTSIASPGNVRAVFHDQDSVLWLSTSNSGLLKYDWRQSRLIKGNYTTGIDGDPIVAKQLYRQGDTLWVVTDKNQALIFHHNYWDYPHYYDNVKKLIPHKDDFIVIKTDNALIKDGWSYFDAELDGTALTTFKGELMPDSQKLLVVLPENKMSAYQFEKRQWVDLPFHIPPYDSLVSFHAVGDRYTFVTQDGKVFNQYNNFFSPMQVPGSLDQVIALAPTTQKKEVILAWPDKVAFYHPLTGAWEEAQIEAPSSPFKGVGAVGNRVYAFNENNLWEIEQGVDSSEWQQLSLSRPGNRFWFSKNHVWYANDDGVLSALRPGTNNDKLTYFFEGSFPELDQARYFILQSDRFLWAIHESHVGRYDKQKHAWLTQPLDVDLSVGDSIQQAVFHHGKLYVRTNEKVFAMRYAGERFKSEVVPLDFQPYKLTLTPGSVLIWKKDGNHLSHVNLTDIELNTLSTSSGDHQFSGDLTEVPIAQEVGKNLWVADKGGHFGVYNSETQLWKNHQFKGDEKPLRFVQLFNQTLLETQAGGSRIYYHFNLAIDSLEQLDWVFKTPSFQYYPLAERLFLADGGNVIFEIEPSKPGFDGVGNLRIRPLNKYPAYKQLSTFRTKVGDYVVLLEHKVNRTQAILYKDQLVEFPPTLQLKALKKAKVDKSNRLWFLGDNSRLYITQLDTISRENQTPFEQQLAPGLKVVDLTNDFSDQSSATIHTFDVYDGGNQLRVWLANSSKITQYELNSSDTRFSTISTLDLPRTDITPTELTYPGPGLGVIIAQQNNYYQYAPEPGGFQRFKNIFTRYDSENWKMANQMAQNIWPASIDPTAQKVWAKFDLSKPRWRLKSNDKGYIDFSYQSDTTIRRYIPLGITTHQFKKDIVYDLATHDLLYLWMATEDGLLQYDASGTKQWRPAKDGAGKKIEDVDQIYSLNGMLWLRQNGEWNRAVRNKNELWLSPSTILQTVHFDSTRQLTWMQTAPGKTQIKLADKDIIEQNGLKTDQFLDLIVADTNIFISTKGGIWQTRDDARFDHLRLSADIPNVRFYQPSVGNIYAISPEAGTFQYTEKGWEAVTDKPTTPRLKYFHINGSEWQMEEGKTGIVPITNRQIRQTDNGIFTDDVIYDVIPYSNGYWMASCGGIWFLAKTAAGFARGKTLLTDKSFTHFFKDGHQLFVADSQDKVYEFRHPKWVEVPGRAASQLSKEMTTGSVCFTQIGDEVKLERTDQKVGPVWANNALIGDGISDYAVVGDHLWGFLPGKGLARYKINIDFLIRLDTLYKETFGDYPPVKGHFLQPSDEAVLYFKTEYQNWVIQGDSIVKDSSNFWDQPQVVDRYGKLEWYRQNPLAETVQLRVNGQNVPNVFADNRMAFDDYQTVYANGDGTFWLGTSSGLYRFTSSEFKYSISTTISNPTQSVLMDFIPDSTGIKVIAEENGYLYVINGLDQKKILTANGFEETANDQAFWISKPELTYANRNLKWQQKKSPGNKYASGWEVNLPDSMPLFNNYGTFTFDQFNAASPAPDSSWLGASAVGLMKYQANPEGHWDMKGFYPYPEISPGIVIRDIKNEKGERFLRGTDQQNKHWFYQWITDSLQAYDETAKHIFDRQQLLFTPDKMQWDLQRIPFDSSSALVIDSSYPFEIFKGDPYNNQKGRFSFDAIYNIRIENHTLWAETEAGLVEYLFQPGAETPEEKLVFQSFTPSSVVKEPQAEPIAPEAKYATIFNRDGLDIQRELGSLNRIIKLGPLEWKALALPVPERQVKRIADTLYYLQQDSFLFQFNLQTGSKKRMEALYVVNQEAPVNDFYLPLELGSYNDTLVIVDDKNQRYGALPIQNDSVWINRPLELDLLFHIGPLIFKNFGNQLLIRGEGIPPMLLDEKPYAVAWREKKLWVCPDSPESCTVITYHPEQERYQASIQEASFILADGLYVEGLDKVRKFPEKDVSYEIMASLGPGATMEPVTPEKTFTNTADLAIEDKQVSTTYEISDGGQLLINGQMVNRTNDLIFNTRISNVVDMKKGPKRIWVATPGKLIQIKY